MKQVCLKWKNSRLQDISQGYKIDEILSANIACQWLVCELTRNNVPFKIINLGAGCKRITTETEICPCCKKKF
jgi:hypothetical protein